MPTDRQKLGALGEELAEKALHQKGYTLIARNFRCPYGEVDRVMQDKDTLVFVEVKTRRSDRFGLPAESINTFKRHQITLTALHYLQVECESEEYSCRFDAVEVLLVDGSPPELRHLIGIFDAEV